MYVVLNVQGCYALDFLIAQWLIILASYRKKYSYKLLLLKPDAARASRSLYRKKEGFPS